MKTRKPTRRTILKGLAATALGAPVFVPASALGRAEKAPASERVTLASIGVGGRGRSLLGEFQRCKNAQVVAIADCYADRRDASAALTGGKAYADFRAVLERKDIDAVIVATPDHWHVPIALAAARAGKHAYVEKPLGVSIEQDLVCRKVFQETGRVFQYGTQQRSSAHCHQGCELVRNGRVGQLRAIEVVAPDGGAGGSTEEKPVPPGFDYEMWMGPAPRKPFTASRCNPPGTYWIYDYSIGYLAGWGAHPLDIMVWGTDVDTLGPMTVSGTGVVPDKGLYDTVHHWDVTIALPQGVRMTFKPGGDSTKFIGSEGWIAVSRGGLKAEPMSLLDAPAGAVKTPLVRSSSHAQNFLDAIQGKTTAVSSLEHAVRSDILSHLCDIAIRLKRPITWDPAQARIVNDAEAAARMRRPMRDPWTL